MIVFKTFLKVLNRCKLPIILYTVLLIAFSGFQMQSSESTGDFTAEKPDIFIINRDEADTGITKSLVEYMERNCTLAEISMEEDAIRDALFYRDVNCILYIPQHFGSDFLSGRRPEIEIKSTGDYQSSYAEMLLSRYLKVAGVYAQYIDEEDVLVPKIEETLRKQVPAEVDSALDTEQMSRATFYFNFASYSLLAGCVYVICLILSSFQEERIRKRTVISSMNDRKFNRLLLLSNGLFAVVLWMFYLLLSFVLVGKVMFTAQGLLFALNSFVFMVCALTMAFFIGNLVKSKNAVNGIVNVVALGSSFLCGAFVPVQWLPDSVLKAAHILPAYWYIQTNEFLKTAETVTLESLKPVFGNMAVILLFALLFVLAAGFVSRRRRKLG